MNSLLFKTYRMSNKGLVKLWYSVQWNTVQVIKNEELCKKDMKPCPRYIKEKTRCRIVLSMLLFVIERKRNKLCKYLLVYAQNILIRTQETENCQREKLGDSRAEMDRRNITVYDFCTFSIMNPRNMLPVKNK